MTIAAAESEGGGETGVIDLRAGSAPLPERPAGFPGRPGPLSRYTGFDVVVGCGGPDGSGGRAAPAAKHVVVVAVQGRLKLASFDQDLEIAPGEVALVGPGTPLDWSAEPDSRWVVNTYADAAGQPGLRRVATDMPLTPGPASAAELLLTDAPECLRGEAGAASDGLWCCGIWQATAYARRPITYDHDEMMLLLEGEVALTTPSGRVSRFAAGDLILIPAGAELGWRSDCTVKKFWSIHRPAAKGD